LRVLLNPLVTMRRSCSRSFRGPSINPPRRGGPQWVPHDTNNRYSFSKRDYTCSILPSFYKCLFTQEPYSAHREIFSVHCSTNRNHSIVFTIFQLIRSQTKFRLNPNQPENGKYRQIWVDSTRTRNWHICVRITRYFLKSLYDLKYHYTILCARMTFQLGIDTLVNDPFPMVFGEGYQAIFKNNTGHVSIYKDSSDLFKSSFSWYKIFAV